MIKFKELAFIAPCMSAEEVRYYLCGVFYQYEHARRMVTITATNGHALHSVRYELTLQEAEASAPGADASFIFPAPAVKAMLKQGGNFWRVEDNGLEAVDGATYAPINGTYPDITRSIPNITDQTAEHVRATFNVEYLKRTASALAVINGAALTKKSALCTPIAVFGSDRSACVMASKDADITAAQDYVAGKPGHILILMPMRSQVSCAGGAA